MSIETHRVVIGACGWKHQGWVADFYSEDLPEDWQLGFYSNEFTVVYVPAEDWLDDLSINEWLEDISGSFRFILEIPDKALLDELLFSQLLAKAKTLAEHCLGFVFQLNPAICDDTPLFLSRFDTAQAIAPVCVDKRGLILTDEFKTVLSKHHISEVWNGRQLNNVSVNSRAESLGLTRANLAITHVSGEDLDMAGLRKVIEICLQASSEDCISVLCIDGNPPSIEILRNADVILNLL